MSLSTPLVSGTLRVRKRLRQHGSPDSREVYVVRPFEASRAGRSLTTRPNVQPLAGLKFVREAEVVIFAGPPGVGKTHLAIGLGMEAIRVGYSVYFITLSQLADQVPPDHTDPRWAEKLRVLSSPRLLIVDEVGYVPLDRMLSQFVFSLVCRHYEKGAMIWTSNKCLAEWAGVFAGDEVLTAAILDRLLHHGTVVNIRGQSHRLKDRFKAGTAESGDRVAGPTRRGRQEQSAKLTGVA